MALIAKLKQCIGINKNDPDVAATVIMPMVALLKSASKAYFVHLFVQFHGAHIEYC
jgi:hypothetical protein